MDHGHDDGYDIAEYINGMKNGHLTGFYPYGGGIMKECDWINGEMHGKYTIFFPFGISVSVGCDFIHQWCIRKSHISKFQNKMQFTVYLHQAGGALGVQKSIHFHCKFILSPLSQKLQVPDRLLGPPVTVV